MISTGSIRQTREAAGLAWTIARPRRTLFVLGHMRSYSSLLCHILASNSAVTGYVEQHMNYGSFTDLYKLRAKVAMMHEGRLKGPYVLDKLLFNRWSIDDTILERKEVRTVFSIREPEATIKSTIAMAGGPKNIATNWKADAVKVADYYNGRLDGLVKIAERRPRNTAFFVAERLIDRTDDTLALLTDYLGVRKPLTPSYERFELTQKARFGDPGKYISTGEIVTERRQHDFELPDGLLEESRRRFEATFEALTSLCGTTLPGDHA